MKMSCPACGAYTSRVLEAYQEEEPCPYCGLSAAASAEILGIQQSRADGELKAKLAEEIKRRDAAEAKVSALEAKLERMRRAVREEDDR